MAVVRFPPQHPFATGPSKEEAPARSAAGGGEIPGRGVQLRVADHGHGGSLPMPELPERIVFLVDVDNTLLDNDRVIVDLHRHIERDLGHSCRDYYFEVFEQLRSELGYADYLGALQRYRVAHPHETGLLEMSRFLLEYPFANRLFPGSLDVLDLFNAWGKAVVLSDGDVVFQPRKVMRSGIFEAVEGRVLIYIHKEEELEQVEKTYPADHYVLVDDKVRLLTAIKKAWGSRLTTIFPRQGHYAVDPRVADYPRPDITVQRIGDLVNYDLETIISAAATGPTD
jgi:FMN phosphatase YigB (HAD superfamily)